MTTRLGSGDYVYEELADWAKLPEGWSFKEVADVVVDSQDRVYVFNRGEHPMMVFEQDGSFVAAWGEGLFTRPHGLTLGPDGALYCADDDGHCIRKCSLDGQLLMTIGTPGEPAPRQSGKPFNRPTKVAFDPKTGDLYISDGYGNAKVHKFSADGKHLFSWGDYGTDPGQFNLVHSICTDREGKVYIADRENHRVQIFDEQGNYLGQWNNLHRPCGLHIEGELVYIGQLPTHLAVNADYPNLGACVSIHDMTGHRLAKLGDVRLGEKPGQFTAPHGLAVDSHGDIYVGEVSWSAYGRNLEPPRTARCFRKLVKVN
ncbi:MAG: peptidyl-alpha-hydroxyglycine alpha-amidating lyase family protein [Candidatus Poribacteria bacterium]